MRVGTCPFLSVISSLFGPDSLRWIRVRGGTGDAGWDLSFFVCDFFAFRARFASLDSGPRGTGDVGWDLSFFVCDFFAFRRGPLRWVRGRFLFYGGRWTGTERIPFPFSGISKSLSWQANAKARSKTGTDLCFSFTPLFRRTAQTLPSG